MIRLHNFGQFGELPDPSSFCLKVDAYLRMAGLEFEVVSGLDNLKQAPKGKLPFIEDGDRIVPDSEFIIAHLKQNYGDTLDQHLTPQQKATAHAFTKMMDENLYWCLVWCRWISDDIWPDLKQNFFGSIPFPIRNLVAAKLRRGVRKTLHNQGLGRHSVDEIRWVMERDLAALSDQLGDQTYFFGDRPSTLDATAYGLLAELILAPLQSSMTKIALQYPNLVSFCHRVRSAYYAEDSQ